MKALSSPEEEEGEEEARDLVTPDCLRWLNDTMAYVPVSMHLNPPGRATTTSTRARRI